MKRKTIILTSAAAIIGLGTAFALSSPSFARGPMGQGYGPGQMGGQMGGYGMQSGPCQYNGQAMMGKRGQGRAMRGRGQGQAFGPGFAGQPLEKALTVADVKKSFEDRMKWRGNDRVKVGNVVKKDDLTIVVDIVTVDDSLIRKIEVNSKTGQRRPVR